MFIGKNLFFLLLYFLEYTWSLYVVFSFWAIIGTRILHPRFHARDEYFLFVGFRQCDFATLLHASSSNYWPTYFPCGFYRADKYFPFVGFRDWDFKEPVFPFTLLLGIYVEFLCCVFFFSAIIGTRISHPDSMQETNTSHLLASSSVISPLSYIPLPTIIGTLVFHAGSIVQTYTSNSLASGIGFSLLSYTPLPAITGTLIFHADSIEQTNTSHSLASSIGILSLSYTPLPAIIDTLISHAGSIVQTNTSHSLASGSVIAPLSYIRLPTIIGTLISHPDSMRETNTSYWLASGSVFWPLSNTPLQAIIGEFCVCKQTTLCLSHVISHGCLLRLVAVERNAFLLYFAPLKILFTNKEQS